jgi:hypothetical protein
MIYGLLKHLRHSITEDESAPIFRQGDQVYFRYDSIVIKQKDGGAIVRFELGGKTMATLPIYRIEKGDSLHLMGLDGKVKMDFTTS